MLQSFCFLHVFRYNAFTYALTLENNSRVLVKHFTYIKVSEIGYLLLLGHNMAEITLKWQKKTYLEGANLRYTGVCSHFLFLQLCLGLHWD